jgi:titin
VEWVAPADNGGTPLTEFKLYWSLDDFTDPIKTVNSDTLSVGTNQLDGLVTGDLYTYKVVATNLIGDSEPSVALEDVVAAQTPSEPINFIRSQIITPIEDEISIQWEHPVSNGGSPVIGYILYWNKGAIGGNEPKDELAQTDADTLFHTQIGLIKGQAYLFSVAAINLVDIGAKTTLLELVASQAPSVATNVIRSSFDSVNSIQISWTAPADDGGSPDTIDYIVYSDMGDQTSGSEYVAIAETTLGETQYTASVLTGQMYFFKVLAFNDVDAAPLSIESASMLAGSVPSAPLDLQLVSQSEFQIKFSWTEPEDLGGIPLIQYAIYWDYGVVGTQITSMFGPAGFKLPDETIYT